MSRVPETVVAAVVADVSKRMSDPSYAQVAIGSFAQAHPDVGRFIAAHKDELGDGEAVIHAVFHAEVIHECFRRHLGRYLAPIGFAALDDASGDGVLERFARTQPALADYLKSNLDNEVMQRLLALVGTAMDE